jgi:hypothetical protein
MLVSDDEQEALALQSSVAESRTGMHRSLCCPALLGQSPAIDIMKIIVYIAKERGGGRGRDRRRVRARHRHDQQGGLRHGKLQVPAEGDNRDDADETSPVMTIGAAATDPALGSADESCSTRTRFLAVDSLYLQPALKAPQLVIDMSGLSRPATRGRGKE